MVSERDRILKLVNYIESFGIDVNLSKNKARGHRGFFKFHDSGCFRIDISNRLSEFEILEVLIHEFAHYVHYIYDKSLLSLDFAFGVGYEDFIDELIQITVDLVPKSFASAILNKKDSLNNEIKTISNIIKSEYPSFKISRPFMPIESNLKKPFNYLVKYDRVKVNNKIYSVSSLNENSENLSKIQIAYIDLKSKQRELSRLNSKIFKYNRYYNSQTELFARFCELYFLKNDKVHKLAPNLSLLFSEKLKASQIKQLNFLEDLM